MGQSLVTKEQMIKYFQNNNSGRSNEYVEQFVSFVIIEANIEGVRPEVAFALMMKETNFLKFGGTVIANQNNFGGLGVTGPGIQGASFNTIQIGIRAIIQHLQAYASDLPLQQQVVDPRYQYVTRGSAPYAEWLGISENPSGKGWGSDPGYGYDIVNRVNQMKGILLMKMFVDTPKNGSTITGSTTISGWALNMSGISKVELYNGKTMHQGANLNISYHSVNVAFPGYPSGDNSGFSMLFDSTKLPNGTQNLTVVATSGINGITTTWPLTINTPRVASDALVSFLTSYEGFSATPYRGGADPWNLTVGYGHLIIPGENFTSLTPNQGLALLKKDLVRYEASVNDEFGDILNQNQFDSLVSFCFNTGANVWPKAYLTYDVKSGASADILKTDFTNWDHVNGEVALGLYRRRYDEWEMFVCRDYARNYVRTLP